MDLTGKTVVLTGTFPIPRAEAEAALTALGAKISGSLSKKTDILFVGTDAGSKLNKAQALQVPIRDSADLMALIHSTPAPFWQTPLQGTEPDFLARLQALPWENFSPERDLLPLRAALLQNEAHAGINEAQRFASEKLQKYLTIAHPYVHRVELSAFALSPDGRHLAVGSWVGDDYDAGGFLQIWDTELGRCVNNIPIRGGVGWPDYGRCIQWRPDGQALGLAYDTNGVGSLNPWNNDGLTAHAYITDGWSRPPAWAWSPDGKEVFISCWGDNDKIPGARLTLIGSRPTPHWSTGSVEGPIEPHHSVYWYADPDGKSRIVGHNSHGHAFCIDGQTGAFLWESTAKAPVAWTPDTYAHLPAGLAFYSSRTGQPTPHLPMHMGAERLHWSPDGHLLAAVVCSENDFNAEAGVHLYRDGVFCYGLDAKPRPAHYSQPDLNAWAFSQDGQFAACLQEDNTVLIWDLSPLHTGGIPVQHAYFPVQDIMGLCWGIDHTLIALGPQRLAFYKIAPELKCIGDFQFCIEPTQESPLQATEGLESLHDLYAFPLQEHWALLIPDVALCGPQDTDPHLCWRVNQRFAWPLRWHPLPQFPDLPSLVAAKLPNTPPILRRHFKKAPTAAPRAPQSWPPTQNTTLDDILRIHLESLQTLHQGWSYHLNQHYKEHAVVLAQLKRPQAALALLPRIQDPNARREADAYVARELAAGGFFEEARALAEAITDAEAHQACMVYANIGAVWALLGDKDKAQNYFAKAEKAKLPETNSFENRVALASALIVSGDMDAACKALKGTSDTPSSWQMGPLMQQLAATPAQVEPFVAFLYKHKWHNEFEVLDGLVNALIQEAAWDKLKKWLPRFDRLSTTAYEQKIALARSGNPTPAFNPSPFETDLATADSLDECKTIGQRAAQGGRMDLAGLAFQKAQTLIRPNCKDLDLEELLTAQAEAGDLAGAYANLMLIPKGKRSYRNRGLLTICAKTKNYAALADLLLKMPSDDMNHRPQASLRCLRLIADVPGTGTLF